MELPTSLALQQGAANLLNRHFDALNRADEQAFRRTAYIPEAADGEPYRRWWNGMRSLRPYELEMGEPLVDERVRSRPMPHLTVSIEVTAQTFKGARAGTFLVYYVIESAEFLLGCRVHWWVDTSAG
ncbi:MAG: hypothetical protein KC912_19960 [Proteobacteria bacterium]|nr:hypothetical protein [Pseudomonadota bacterium]